MTFSLRHITLLIGILTTILSFLWYGRDSFTYDLIILAGLTIAAISFLVILFKEKTIKNKTFWFLVVIASVGLQQLTNPFFIKVSYKHFIKQHENSLTSTTELIKTKKNIRFLLKSAELLTRENFTQQEVNQVVEGLKKTRIFFIEKDSSKITYRTVSMIDGSHSFYYFYSGDKPNERYKQIFNNWYYTKGSR
jgi:hypothetical protein